MLYEADEFFDRALALYLLRSHLRELQASTWAGVATYYTNYFLALSFIRLHMRSVTQLPSPTFAKVTGMGSARKPPAPVTTGFGPQPGPEKA